MTASRHLCGWTMSDDCDSYAVAGGSAGPPFNLGYTLAGHRDLFPLASCAALSLPGVRSNSWPAEAADSSRWSQQEMIRGTEAESDPRSDIRSGWPLISEGYRHRPSWGRTINHG